MDLTERKITKIAREASKLAVRTLKEDGIGTAEYDFIHLVRQSGGQGLPDPAGQPQGRPQPAAFRHGKGGGSAELQGAGGDHLL